MILSAQTAMIRLSSGEAIAPDVFRRLWSDDHQGFRTQIVEWISESIERDGSTSRTGWPTILRNYFTVKDVQELFLEVRDRAARLEPEWRASFADAFQVNDNGLPSYDTGSGLMYYSICLLRAFAAHNDLTAFDLVNEGLSRGIPLSQIYYSTDELNEGGISLFSEQQTAVQVATALGMWKAAAALDS